MSIYKGFPSKSYLPVLKRYGQKLVAKYKDSFGFMAGNRVKKITAVLSPIQADVLATSPEGA